MQLCHFEQNYLFFSTMLASKGAPSFRTRLLAFFMEEFTDEIDTASGKNNDLSEDVIVQFTGTAYVGVMEWWLRNGMPYPPQVMAKQVGTILERSL
jgi:hypothetical protein